MDAALIERWNRVVAPTDDLYHLGDFAVRQKPERIEALLQALHGRKHLIIGNNDGAATRDARGGKYDLALQEYQNYLKYYKDNEYAPNAQFNIGVIHYTQKDLETALADFDAVLEKYPDNPKTPDALLMKGKTLVGMGRPTQGAAEFRELIKRFPNTDQATQAKAQLKALGLPYNSGAAPAKKRTR